MTPLLDWGDIFSFQDYGALLALLSNSLIAGAVLGLVGGLIGVFVMQRDMAFAVHGISELSFAGAAAALLVGAEAANGRPLTVQSTVLCLLNAVMVALAAGGAYDAATTTPFRHEE